MNHLARRAGSINWYYRESTPADVRKLRAQQGLKSPRDVWISLGTPDRRLANSALPAVRAKQHRKWAAVRDTAIPVNGIPSTQDLRNAVADFVHGKFVELHRQNLRDSLEAGVSASEEASRRRDKIVQFDLLPTSDDVANMEAVAAALCRQKGWDLGPGDGVRGQRWDEAVTMATRGVQHARGEMIATLEGRPLADREAVVRHLGGKHQRNAKNGETILELFDLYKVDGLRDGKSADTFENERKVMGHFATFVGDQRHVADIGRPDIREFRKALLQVPHRWTARPEFKGMNVASAALHWKQQGGQGRATRTIAKELSGLSSFFIWLGENAYLEEDNPTKGFAPRFDKSEAKYPPYSLTQLQVVFSGSLFDNCNQAKPHVVGTHRIRDWRYWLPLCALYSGARTSEIAQLLCSDVRQEQGVWVFDINDKVGGGYPKSLKNKWSRRLVPVHPKLVELGLLEHRDVILAAGGVQLFPEIKPGPRGDMGYQPSKFWQRHLKNIGLKEKGLCLHSFRHTFADDCRRHSVSKDLLRALMGHADGSMTGYYGALDEGTLAERQAAIYSLLYGGLDIGSESTRKDQRLPDVA